MKNTFTSVFTVGELEHMLRSASTENTSMAVAMLDALTCAGNSRIRIEAAYAMVQKRA